MKGFAKDAESEIFGAGLPAASCDGECPKGKRLPIVGGEILQSIDGIGDKDDGEVGGEIGGDFLDDCADCASAGGFIDQAMAIEVFTANGDEEVAGLKRASVCGKVLDGGGFGPRHQITDGPLSDLAGSGWIHYSMDSKLLASSAWVAMATSSKGAVWPANS